MRVISVQVILKVAGAVAHVMKYPFFTKSNSLKYECLVQLQAKLLEHFQLCFFFLRTKKMYSELVELVFLAIICRRAKKKLQKCVNV